MTEKKYLLYRVWYGDDLVYVGRTKQPLQSRIRGHLFAKPMHRIMDIDLITKIEYAELPTEADMNIYEIYLIALWHPPMNVDDKPMDKPALVSLPALVWQPFETRLWEKWKTQIHEERMTYSGMRKRLSEIREQQRIFRSLHREGQMTAYDLEIKMDSLREEQERLKEELLCF